MREERPAVTAAGQSGAAFPLTEWSLVLEARQVHSHRSAAALERLCRAYWPAIYAFLRQHGFSPTDAQDATQEFILCLLRRQSLSTVDPAKGRFRSFLLGALKHFLSDAQRKLHAEKRIDRHVVFSLDDPDVEKRFPELASDLTPEKSFDRRWAWTVLDQALRRLRKDYDAAGRLAHFESLKPFLTGDAGDGAYEGVAAQLGMKSGAVAVAVHRLRSRFRKLVRAQVAQTVSNPADVDDELRNLFA